MRRILFLTVLMAGIAFETTAQTDTQEPQDSRATVFPYIGQENYNAVDINTVPPEIQTTFGRDYAGITNATWDYNNDVYRSTFMRDGKSWSVLYSPNGRLVETRTATTTDDLPPNLRNSLRGKTASSLYEIKVGVNTYYSTRVGGKDMYYDSNGNSLKIPKRK